MNMNHLRMGSGKPLLLIHGLGGSARSWSTICSALAERREVIAVDLPGFGATPPLAGETSIRSLSDAVTAFLDAQGLRGIDAVGSSMGARLVLELARRGGVLGSVVSLDPGGFWRGWERTRSSPRSGFRFARCVYCSRSCRPSLAARSRGRCCWRSFPGDLGPSIRCRSRRNAQLRARTGIRRIASSACLR